MAWMVAGLATTSGLTALITPNIFRRNKEMEISNKEENPEVENEEGE